MAHEGSAMSRRGPRLPNSSVPLGAPVRATGGAATNARRRLGAPAGELHPTDEGARTRLIGEISCLLREPAIPESARSAGLELIGWLARRMPGEAAHALGVKEALAAERAPRRKAR
jgi:hypothetical protein